MRIKIVLDIQGDEPRMLPSSYQPEFSSWIFQTLNFGNDSFTNWLKQKGYLNRNNEYTLYTFSNLFLSDIRHKEDRLLINQDQTSLYLSFLAHEDIEPFIIDLFNGLEPRIGDKKSKVQFRVSSVERLPDPVFSDQMTLSAISPIVLTATDGKKQEFISPEKKDYGVLFLKNLMAKYAALIKQLPEASPNGLQGLSNLKFSLLDKPRPRIVKINPGTAQQESIKGFLFDFSVKAPAELIRLGYYAGFGDQCQYGFGCCDIK